MDERGKARARMKSLSVAQVRKMLPVGARAVFCYIGPNKAVREGPDAVTNRVVIKQTARIMVTTRDDGGDVDNTWEGVTARQDGDKVVLTAHGHDYVEITKIEAPAR